MGRGVGASPRCACCGDGGRRAGRRRRSCRAGGAAGAKRLRAALLAARAAGQSREALADAAAVALDSVCSASSIADRRLLAAIDESLPAAAAGCTMA